MKPIYFKKSLGIDIRDESVSLTLMGSQLRNLDIIDFHFFKIKSLTQGDEDSERYFLEEVNRFLLQHDIVSTHAAVSLPRSLTSLQSLELPAPDRDTVDSMIVFELEKHFLAKPEDLYFTYHATATQENHFHIVLSAVKKEIANYYQQLIERLPLKVAVIDSSILANLNLILNDQTHNQLLAMIDLCSNTFDISIVKRGALEISRNIPIKNPVTRNSYFLNNLPAEYHASLSSELGKDIVSEIVNTLSCCNRIGKDETIEQIYIMGGGHYAEDVAREIEESSGVSTIKVTPPYRVNSALPIDLNPAYFSTSLSLASRELKRCAVETNLLPESARPKRKKSNIWATVALTLITILLSVGFVVGKNMQKKVALAAIEKQLQDVKTQVAPLEKIDIEYEEIKQYADIIRAIKKYSPLKLPAMEELTRILPQNTWLTDISIVKEKVEIKGVSATASALIPLLENSIHFKDAGFNGSVVKTPDGERFSIRFNLKDDK